MTSYSVTEAANQRLCCHIWPKLTAKVERARLDGFASYYVTNNYTCSPDLILLNCTSTFTYKLAIWALFIHPSIKIIRALHLSSASSSKNIILDFFNVTSFARHRPHVDTDNITTSLYFFSAEVTIGTVTKKVISIDMTTNCKLILFQNN